MSRNLALILSATLLVALTVASPAAATAQRTFVSINGVDTNGCTPTAPCRSFGAAFALLTTGGDIVAIDSGGYGAVTIDRNANIIAAPGVYAGISVFSGNGITIAGSGPRVTLRNLTITGLGGVNGIADSNGSLLYVENCTIEGFTGSGLVYTNGSNWAGGNLVRISDSNLRDNGYGVRISAAASFYLHTVIKNTNIESNGVGVQIDASGFNRTAIIDSVLLNNGTGLYQVKTGGVSGLAEIEHSLLTGNTTGITSNGSGGPSVVRVSNSVLTGNPGVVINPINTGQIESRINNTIEGNSTNGVFTGTYVAK